MVPALPWGAGRAAPEGICLLQCGAGTMDLREYLVALSVVCRPAQTLDTMQLAFKASAGFTWVSFVGTVTRESHQTCAASFQPLRWGKRNHVPEFWVHTSSEQPLCVKNMHGASQTGFFLEGAPLTHKEGTRQGPSGSGQAARGHTPHRPPA